MTQFQGEIAAHDVYSLVMVNQRLLPFAILAALLTGCMTPEDPATTEATESTESELGYRVCTPGQQMCDFGCFYVGGPSTDDCIVQCNATGSGWSNVENCGYAQNFPFSASCRDAQPRPVCEWN
jgi:hypothetical protein